MILVDTSVWIDHLHMAESDLAGLLETDQAGCHPLVIEELALGSIKGRMTVLDLLASLVHFPTLTHDEVLALVGGRQLWGRGLSAVDAHLLGSVALVGGARLFFWTRDKRLGSAARDLGISLFGET